MAKVVEGGFAHRCKHDSKEKVVRIKNFKGLSEFVVCFECGDVFFGDEWFSIKILIITLLAGGDEKEAMALFSFMEKCRKTKLFSYTYFSEEDLRRSAKKMKKVLEKYP